MGFTLSKMFWWFAAPANLALVVLAVALLALVLGRRGFAGVLLATVVAAGMALTLLPMKDWVLRPLEDRFPVPALQRVDGVIVLGGAIDTWLSADRGQPVINDSAERLTAFVDLARRYPEARLVFTGGSAGVFDDTAREADIARDLFARLGVAPERVLYERDSRNTLENAVFARRLVAPLAEEHWLLVTSAYHMPRAIGTFRRQGWVVTAYPVDFSVPRAGNQATGSLLEGLNGVHWGIREWLGLGYYRLQGFTDSWFPAP